jgi:hypothetical protein
MPSISVILVLNFIAMLLQSPFIDG